MSKLTESEYEEYILLLRVWVDAERAEDEVDPEAAAQARSAYAAVQSFRWRYGLGGEELDAEAEPMAEEKR